MKYNNGQLFIDKLQIASLSANGICVDLQSSGNRTQIKFDKSTDKRCEISCNIGKMILNKKHLMDSEYPNFLENNNNIEIMKIRLELQPNKICNLMDFSIRLDLSADCIADKKTAKESFHWIPAIKSDEADIIGDHFFRSPVVISTYNGKGAALIPEPEYQKDYTGASKYLDLKYRKDQSTNSKSTFASITYGKKRLRVSGHVYFQSENKSFQVDETGIDLSFYLIVFDNFSQTEILPKITSFVWDLYSKTYEKSILPQVILFNKYALYGNGMAMQYLWQKGSTANSGGICLTTLRREDGVIRGREYPDDIWFHAWFNNMRTAMELAWFGSTENNIKWMKRAKDIARLLLSAPQKNGLFPTIYIPQNDSWVASSAHGGGKDLYSLPDCSWAAIWLRKYTNEFGEIAKTDEFLKRLRDFICKNQDSSGGLPCWVDVNDFKADMRLNNTSAGALALWFIGEEMIGGNLSVKEQEINKIVLQKGSNFIIDNVIPQQKFEDFELYYSCSPNTIGYYDKNTCMFAQNSLALQWCTEALRVTYLATKDKKYLEWGTFCLNILCLYQQAWSNPNLDFYSFGGFGAMNTDGEWNDARQAQFAETLSNYYDVTEDFIYLRKAIAATRAGFALMVIDENKDVCPKNYQGTGVQFEVHGSSAENYGHTGEDKRSYQSGFHWGTGSALVTAAAMKKKYGDIWIDLGNKKAIGIDGIVVNEACFNDSSIFIDISTLEDVKEFELKFSDKSKADDYVIKIESYLTMYYENSRTYKIKKIT
ncbi:MAG: hypothetical protein KAQ68_10435 [Clostridiales bacterium]|nr:hypothetical protein [Clostridiales bacterium]